MFKNDDRTRNVYESKGNSDKMPDKLSGLMVRKRTKLAKREVNSSVSLAEIAQIYTIN